MELKHLLDLIDNRKDELYTLLSDLIKINSESSGPFGNEEPLARYIYKLCTELGLESEIYSPLELPDFENHPDYFPGRHLENRYNVTGIWKGKEDRDELMLMAHTDTLEIGNPENWKLDPISGKIADGKIFGRGACDDKYALATVLFIVKLLREEGFTPSANLVFAAYCDEEQGGSHGAMAACMKNPCKRIISLDGVDGQIWHCASGGQVVRYRFHTKEPVDSAELTASALPIVTDIIKTFKEKRRAELEANRFYKGTIIPETSLRFDEIRAGNNGMDRGVGQIVFTFYTDKTKDEIYKEFSELNALINERLAPLGIVGDGFTPDTRFFHYGYCEPDSEDIKILTEASKEATGMDILVCGSCLSDLSVILKYGSPAAFGFGAGRDFSEEGGAHQPNEYITCESLLNYTKNIAAYILRVLS